MKKRRILSINIFFFTKQQIMETFLIYLLTFLSKVSTLFNTGENLFRNSPTLSKANKYTFIDDNIKYTYY